MPDPIPTTLPDALRACEAATCWMRRNPVDPDAPDSPAIARKRALALARFAAAAPVVLALGAPVSA